jgi:uncharacterized protein
MIWSQFNYLFKTSQNKFYLYNSRTNAFTKLNKFLYYCLQDVSKGKNEINKLEEEIRKMLFEIKAIVHHWEDENYILQQQYLKYSQSFNPKNVLGLVIAPTTGCNFACPYCYEDGINYKSMTQEVENRIVDFIKKTSNGDILLSLGWHGGEPLMKFDSMVRILELISKEKRIILKEHNLVTNGYLLNKEKSKVLNKYKLNSIQITIDGLKEQHDKSRRSKSGGSSFDKIISNIDHISENYPECYIKVRVNIHSDNKADFPILYKELSNRWKNRNCSVFFVYATDYGSCNVACLQNKDKLKFLIELYKDYGINEIKFYPFIQLGGCTADNNNSIVVGPEGEIYKCWVDLGRSNKVVGHLETNDINLDLISDYVIGTDKFSDPKCRKCFLFPVCDGGCGLFRLNYKRYNTKYNVCPIEPEDMGLLLETYLEQKNAKNVFN